MMNRARNDIARRKIFPLRRIALHERTQIGRQQHAAFTTNSFADQQTFSARSSQRRRMKLNVFSVCDPRSGSMGHRQAITARADWICRVSINPSQSAGGENRCAREITMHSLLSAIEDVTTVTGDFAIVVQRIARMMWKRDEVNCSRF